MAKTRGKSFKNDTAVVVLRSGDVLNRVTILEKSFTIETGEISLNIKTESVKTIVYKNLPSYPKDMLRTLSADEFNGVVTNDPVRMKSDTIGTQAIPKANLLSIIF